jgi:hypothetical protein
MGANYLRFVACVCLVFLIPVGYSVAQESKAPRKFDEIEPRYIGDFKMRTYHFCDEGIRKEPGSRVHVIGYDGRRDRLRGMFSPRSVKERLSLVCGIPPEKITATYGGHRRVPTLEFWLVPEGAPTPEPKPTFFPKTRKGRRVIRSAATSNNGMHPTPLHGLSHGG